MTFAPSAAGAYAATQSLVSPLGGVSKSAAIGGISGASAPGGEFGALLQQAVGGVAEAGRKAEGQAMAVASGKADLVEVVTAVAESETALQTLVAVRDRMISAYEEIMRMQI
jgi:flagellar hook-basal body complex protein FliE